MTGAILDNHRQIRRLVYTISSGSNLRFTHRGDFVWHYRRILLNLNVNTEILENELHEALVHLSTDDLQIVELKRRKLMVKDEIERLKHTVEETLH